jgi:hypothetical protein
LTEIGCLVVEILKKKKKKERKEKKTSAFFIACYYLSWRRMFPYILIRLNPPSPKDDLCQVWLKLALLFWRSRKYKGLHVEGNGQQAIRKAHVRLEKNLHIL